MKQYWLQVLSIASQVRQLFFEKSKHVLYGIIFTYTIYDVLQYCGRGQMKYKYNDKRKRSD